MATDVEESDTDDHERPAPPKRQCTRLDNGNKTYESLNERSGDTDKRPNESEECEYDEVERLAREKLRIWQACQVAKGFLDNTINRVMENYILNPPVVYPTDDPQFRLSRGTDMEDTAVMMAIRNHGLVHSTDMVAQSQALCSNAIFGRCGRCAGDEHDDILRPCTASRLPDAAEFSAPSSSAISVDLDAARSTAENERKSIGASADWTEDEKMDESDREQDFLERAVAEAIKKKGLSALSVDYG